MSERKYQAIVDLSLGRGPIHMGPQAIQLDPDGAVDPYAEQALRLSMGINNSSRQDEVAALERFTAGNWKPIELRFASGKAQYDRLSPSLEYYHGPYHRAAWHRSIHGLNLSLGAEVGEGSAVHPAHAHPYAPELALRYCGTDGATTTVTPEDKQIFPGTSLLYYPPGMAHHDSFTGKERFLLDWKIPAVAARVALPDMQPPEVPGTQVIDMLQGNPYAIIRIHDALGGVSFVQIHQPGSTINSYPGVLTIVYPLSNQETLLTINTVRLKTSCLQPAVSTGHAQLQLPESESASITIPFDATSPYAFNLLAL